MIKIIIVAIIAVFTIAVLKEYAGVYSFGVQIYACIFICLLLIPQLISLLNKVYSVMNRVEINSELPAMILKLCGITFVSGVACQVCKDNGNSSLAYLIECSANLCILIIIFPLITEIIENVLSLLFKNW